MMVEHTRSELNNISELMGLKSIAEEGEKASPGTVRAMQTPSNHRVLLKDGREGICNESKTTIKWAKRNALYITVMIDGRNNTIPARLISKIVS